MANINRILTERMRQQIDALKETKMDATQTPDQNYPSREKYWKELSTEEKIERMRRQVKKNDYETDRICNTLRELISDFQIHSHSEGKIVLELKNKNHFDGVRQFSPMRPENPDEVYF